MSWLKPLSHAAERLLAQERDFGSESQARRQRVLARARAAQGLAETAPARFARPRRPALLLAATLVLVIATVSYAAWHEWDRAVERPKALDLPAPTLAPPRRPTPPSSVEGAPPAQSSAAESPIPKKAEPSVAAPSSSATYALELAILERARDAIAKGDHAAGLRAIATHQRRFPAGLLREEREALRVKALAGLGKADEAQRAAEQFRERFPRSVLSRGMDETVKQAR
jgi:hypothetical protein